MKAPFCVVIPSYFTYAVVYLLGNLRDLFQIFKQNKSPEVCSLLAVCLCPRFLFVYLLQFTVNLAEDVTQRDIYLYNFDLTLRANIAKGRVQYMFNVQTVSSSRELCIKRKFGRSSIKVSDSYANRIIG
jgi:hypothetical protein